MNGFNKFLAAAFLSAAMLFSSAVQAMEIRQFDKNGGSGSKSPRRGAARPAAYTCL
jgi:hypothetical protein